MCGARRTASGAGAWIDRAAPPGVTSRSSGGVPGTLEGGEHVAVRGPVRGAPAAAGGELLDRAGGDVDGGERERVLLAAHADEPLPVGVPAQLRPVGGVRR